MNLINICPSKKHISDPSIPFESFFGKKQHYLPAQSAKVNDTIRSKKCLFSPKTNKNPGANEINFNVKHGFKFSSVRKLHACCTLGFAKSLSKTSRVGSDL